MELQDIGRIPNTAPGVSTVVYVAPLSKIDEDNFPVLRTDGNVYENAIETTGDIIFPVVGDGFYSIKALLPYKSNYTSTDEGDVGSKAALNNATFILTGTDVEVRGFRKLIRNEAVVLLWKDKCGTKINMMGLPCAPAYLSEGNLESGAAAGDSRQTSITFESQNEDLLIYTGAITPAV